MATTDIASTFAALSTTLNAPPPWLTPYVLSGRQVAARLGANSVASALNAANNDRLNIRFAPTAVSSDEPYESIIARTQSIPTRNNVHDLLNGLVWLNFPQTKRCLNALQAQQIARRGASGPRGALRDALTLFDENAAVLRAPGMLIDALRRRQWHRLFVEQRAQWQAASLLLFGHALLEKLLQPRKAITAHVWLVDELTDDELTDDALATSLIPERLAAKEFLPLPVLGVPGWWPANEAASFYDDPLVFRAARRIDT